jgi:hypothetical protein
VIATERCQLEPVGNGRPLPALVCAVDELPDLRDSWAWAHAQVTRNPAPAAQQSVAQVLSSYPERNLSRLVSPRRLDPNLRYRACVVPTFASGRKAGLGLPLADRDEQGLQPAWPLSAADSAEAVSGNLVSIRLPVYYSWEFATATGGDFETLVRRLQRPSTPLALESTRVDVSRPGWTIPPLTWSPDGVILELPGALRAPDASPDTNWQGEPRYTFEQALRTLLNNPQRAAQGSGFGVPVVGPPLYGQEQARQFTVPDDQVEPNWLRELNLDPRSRIAAGLGALAVRGEQEALVASAWLQLAERAEQDQQAQRRQQLGAEVADALNAKHLASLSATQLTVIAAPAIRAAASAAAATASASAVSASGASSTAATLANAPMLSTTHRRIVGVLARRHGAIRHTPPGESSTTSTAAVTEPRPAANGTALHALVAPAALLDEARSSVMQQLAATAETPVDEPPPFAPRFDRPAYELLRDYFPDLLLPGLGGVPPNTVALLETNPQFIEAFMVGLNHEIGRELVWRGFPIARRASPFRQFWQSRDSVTPDLPAIDSWTPSSHLGGHFGTGFSSGVLVMLIRGDLLHRYPRTSISAVEATWSADRTRRELTTNERPPIFRASWGLDVTLLGFPLTQSEARGSRTAPQHPGWFFVIQEQLTEPRFGLDAETTVSTPPTTWDDLAWGHLVATPAALAAIRYVPLNGPLQGKALGGVTWGANGAHMAAITQQRAFRAAIHASAWLPIT